MSKDQQRHAILGAALERQAEEALAARDRIIAMAETGQPTEPAPVHWSDATCPRPFNHTGPCWPLGGTHPAS